jgi:glucose-6-phosphate 1-dehydrogenase
MEGSRAWFSQWDQIETCWRLIDTLREAYRAQGLAPAPYAPGSFGPAEADRSLTRWAISGWIRTPLFRRSPEATRL